MKKVIVFLSIVVFISLSLLIFAFILDNNQDKTIKNLQHDIDDLNKSINENNEINESKQLELENLKKENESKLKELDLWKKTQEKLEQSL